MFLEATKVEDLKLELKSTRKHSAFIWKNDEKFFPTKKNNETKTQF